MTAQVDEVRDPQCIQELVGAGHGVRACRRREGGGGPKPCCKTRQRNFPRIGHGSFLKHTPNMSHLNPKVWSVKIVERTQTLF